MRLVAVFAALVVGACSSEPTATPTVFPPEPSTPVNVSGVWLASWGSMNGSGQSCAASATLNLVQAAGSGTFSGTYNSLVAGCGAFASNSAPAWSAGDTVVSGQLVYDANNNIEQAGPARWAPRTVYALGQKVMDANNALEQAAVAGMTVTKPPKWSQTVGGTTVDGNTSPWVASTAFAKGALIVDSNNNIDSVTTAGTSGAAPPTWSLTVGGTTADGTITWTNLGPAVTWTNLGADVTGATSPTWNTTVGGTTVDGSVAWTNTGPLAATPAVGRVTGTVSGYDVTMDLVDTLGLSATFHHVGIVNDANPAAAPWAAATAFTKGSQIVDAKNNIEQANNSGTSGATAPTWNTTVGGTTIDGTVTWTNLGTRFQLVGTTVWTNASYKALWIVPPCGNTIANANGCSSTLSVAADAAPIPSLFGNWVATSH